MTMDEVAQALTELIRDHMVAVCYLGEDDGLGFEMTELGHQLDPNMLGKLNL